MKNVLLVEDDPKLSTALQMRLQHMNYAVSSVSDAVRAMDAAIRSEPDLIILDINLPGGDGFIVADRLRKNPSTMTTPIIFITASAQPELQIKAQAMPGASFLQKPFDAVELQNVIEESVGY